MKDLFEETCIGSIGLKNRFLRSSTWEGMAGENGEATESLVDQYRELARGGVGLILTGHAYVSKRGKASPRQLGIYDDRLIPGLKIMTEAVHAEGGKIAVQLGHAGSQGSVSAGLPPYAPSALKERSTGNMPLAMTPENIKMTIEEYAEAARRAAEAGFDAVEIHAAHGYLLSQFLSPYSNRRQDAYGGPIENRARIIFEIFEAVKKGMGGGLPVMIKINCADFDGAGLTFEDSMKVCSGLAEAGIDAIEISGGVAAAKELAAAREGIDSPDKEAYFRDYVKKLRLSVKCPVALVGGIRSLDVINDLFHRGIVQFFSLARPLISEPGLINRWASGNSVRARCISCNKCFQSASEGRLRCPTFEKDNETA